MIHVGREERDGKEGLVISYEGKTSVILAEVTMLLREFVADEKIKFNEKDFDKLKEQVFKSEEEIKQEMLESVTKDLDSLLDFLNFAQRMMYGDKSDD
jgi:hypothetical protein